MNGEVRHESPSGAAPFAYAAGQVGLLAVPELDLALLVAAEIGLLGLLVAPAVGRPDALAVGSATVAFAGMLIGVVLVARRAFDQTWQAVAVLAVVATAVAYVMARYETVRFGGDADGD